MATPVMKDQSQTFNQLKRISGNLLDKHRNEDGNDVQQVRVIKERDGNVLLITKCFVIRERVL